MRPIDAHALEYLVLLSKQNNPNANSAAIIAHRHEHDHFLITIDSMPTLDYVPVRHACWTKAQCSEKDGNANCSCCGHFDWDDCNYCSSCGAKMDGKVKQNA